MTTQQTMETRDGAGDDARARLLAGLPVTERELPLAGVATALLEGGAGAPVVLLHGPAASAAHWLRVIPGLAATHRVIAPDLPGHGASALADGAELDAERMLAWLGALIERTCAAPPVLVGYALGGAVAARFAAAQPDRLAGLVLVDALGLAPFAPAPAFHQALEAFLTEPGEASHDALWQHCALDLDALRAHMGPQWEPFRAYNVDRVRTPSVLGALGAAMAHFGMPAIPGEELERIGVRTTLIWGRHDLATPVAVAEAASARYGWPLQVIEDAADDPPVEQPAAFLDALREALEPALADDLAAGGFSGEAVGPDHVRYHELRRVFNGMIDRRPAVIARCGTAGDVAAALALARDRGLPVSVYGGGHNVTGNAVCAGGVTIDLRPMKALAIDVDGRTCHAGAGLTWGELDAGTQRHGLAVTGGRMSTTGLGGLALGGGSGWIERQCGYTVDNLLEVELVTADGRIVTASEHEHPELFWGTRGGGGNFGVVTRFTLRLHPIGPTVLGGMLLYPAADAAAVLRNFRDAMAGAPDAVGAGVALVTAPDAPFVPAALRGRPAAGVIVCHAGAPGDADADLRPLLAFGPPAADLVGPMPYVELQRLIDDSYPAGMRNHWTGDFLAGLPDAAVDVLCAHHGTVPSPHTGILLLPGGGAAARVPDGTMAVSERTAPFNVHITSLWADPADDAANIRWTRELAAALKPFTTGRVYVNFLDDEGEERVVASFGAAGYARLQALKAEWDPDNVFRSNQNIRPR
jgi:FAD/FMN-containing dehydrogenase/pimeloyl-ACP methyl ester carboxylesterase